MKRRIVLAALAAVVLLLPSAALAAPQAMIAEARVGATEVEFKPLGDFAKAVLTVSTPDGEVLRFEAAGKVPTFGLFDAKGQTRQDGVYTWELRLSPRVTPEMRKAMRAARARGEEVRSLDLVQSGSFAVADGAFVGPGEVEAPQPMVANSLTPNVAADQVIPDDLIVQGSLCVGFDCVNNENFGFDTIRMKENNTRIKFEDTSTGTFPSNDWQLTANDSASGGSNKFSIEDITGVRVPFTIEAGATNNSLFVDSTGRIGFRTATPVLDLHIATSNTPGIRLEQNNSGGFTAQTWDVAGNEANFFVRDVTGGSLLSFRIRPGAPTSSLDISADGDVGVGTGSPDEKLHVEGSDGDTTIKVEETNGTATLRTMLQMVNNGGIQLLYDRTDGANDWQMSNFGGTFQISVPGAATAQFSLNANGDLTIGGTQYLTGSSRSIKENFEAVDTRSILERVVALPMTEWSAKGDETRQRHIGPIAEEWWQAFQLGPDDKHVALGDISGVALAAIQGLHSVVEERDARIDGLTTMVEEKKAQIDQLQSRLAALEALVATLAKVP
jgi:hypothetical protein